MSSGTTNGKPGTVGQAYQHSQELTYAEALERAMERKRSQPLSRYELQQEEKIRKQREKAARKRG